MKILGAAPKLSNALKGAGACLKYYSPCRYSGQGYAGSSVKIPKIVLRNLGTVP